jgi:hypothetical protein
MTQTTTGRARRGRVLRAAGTLALSASLGACALFETDVTNPNAVTEDALNTAAVATNLANGLGASVTRAMAAILGPNAVVSDELTWIGSREAYRQLDEGDVANPRNEYTNENGFPFVSEARWLGDYVVARLEQFDAANSLANRNDLARAYLYSAIIQTLVGELYDDFVFTTQRGTPVANVGEANFVPVAFDTAVARATRGLAVAQATGNAGLQAQLLGIRARAKHSRAIKALLRVDRAATPANPLVPGGAGSAAEDAALAAALMSPGFRFRFSPQVNTLPGINIGFEMNSRLEIRAGNEYIIPNAANTRPLDGLAGIRLNDPISGVPDPALATAINECCRQAVGQTMPMTVISEVDMQLILAEAALAANDLPGFRTRINNVRARSGKVAVDGTSVPNATVARNLLIHERRVNLFLQGRRLMDHYRFRQNADRWINQYAAARRSCFFGISFGEKLSNPLAQPQPAEAYPSYCQ